MDLILALLNEITGVDIHTVEFSLIGALTCLFMLIPA